MSEEKFDIIFRGDVVSGHSIVDVKQRLAQLFKIDSKKVETLFTGRAVPLKRNLDAETSQKYKAILEKAGAQVQVRNTVKTSGQPASKRAAPDPVKDKIPDQGKKLTLKERLALQEQQEKFKREEPQPKAQEAQGVEQTSESGWNLAPLGSQMAPLSRSQESSPAVVDTSALSLRKQEGDLLDDTEKPADIAPSVEPGDYGIATTGSDLLQPEERKRVEEVSIGDIDFDIAEVGADMLDAANKLPIPELEIDTGIFDLAPPGADLGQAKKETPPPPPDTSNISLSE